MATLEFILESTVDDHALIKLVVEISIENSKESVLGDPGYAVWLTLLEEMWQPWHMKFINIHHCVEIARRVLILSLQDIPWMLEHAQRPAELLSRPN